MTLLMIDGFEYDAAGDAVASGKWTFVSGSVQATQPRTGANSLRLTQGQIASKVLTAAQEGATIILGTGVYRTNGTAEDTLLQFRSDTDTTTHIVVNIKVTGEIRVYRGTTLLGTSAAVWTDGVQHYIEVKVVLSDLVGVVVVTLDGTTILNLTGVDTKNGGTKSVIDTVRLLGVVDTSASTYFDDVYLCNGAGLVNNDLLGECRVETIKPNGNGNSSQLVGSDSDSVDNYLLVDETVMSSGTGDYVESSTLNNKDTYAFSNLTEAVATVKGVMVTAYAEKTDAGARSLAIVTRSSGSDFDGADHVLGTSFGFYSDIQETDPNTSTAWTLAGVNAAEFGVKVR